MCFWSKAQQEIPQKESSHKNSKQRKTAGYQEQDPFQKKSHNPLQKDYERRQRQMARDHKACVEQMEKQKQNLMVENLKATTTIQEFQRKQEIFKKSLEREVRQNSQLIKHYMTRVDMAKEVPDLQQMRSDEVFIQFFSICDFFGKPSYRSSINQNSEIVIQKLSQIYNLVMESKYFQRRLLLSLLCYLRFLEEVICKGYSDKVGDLQLQGIRQFMRNHLQQLFELLQQLIELAKQNFKRERSKVLEEGNINTAEEMKLRTKIDELQERIQQLLEENTRQKADNDLLISTNSSLKQQLNRKEARGIQHINQTIGDLQRAVLRRDELEERFKNLEKLVIISNEQVVEALKSKDSSIYRSQRGPQKFKSLLSDETEPERKQLTQEISLRDEKISYLQSQLHNKQKRIKTLEQSAAQQTASSPIPAEALGQRKKLQKKLKEKIQQISFLKQKIYEVQQEGRRDAEELQQVRKDLQKSRSHNIELQRSNSFLTKEINKLYNQIKGSSSIDEQKILTLQMETNDLRENNSELTSKIDTLSIKIRQEKSRFEIQLNEEKYKRSEAEMCASRAESQIQSLKAQLKNEVSKTQRLKKEMENQIKKIKLDAEKWRQQAEKLGKQFQMSREQLSTTAKKVQQLKIQISQRTQYQNQFGNNTTRMRTASFVEHKTLFIGELLERRKSEKKYLMDAIERLMQVEIQKTKLLYEFKRDRNTNFHNYLDGHSNLVLILETQKALIACYYSGTLQEEKPMTEQALLISLDSRKTFYLNTLKHNPSKDPKDTRVIRGMVFDKYFLIFGNAEVRLRSGQARVFSNFGIMSSYFDCRKEKANALLHEGSNNQVDIINYEIHEVFFNEEFTLEVLR